MASSVLATCTATSGLSNAVDTQQQRRRSTASAMDDTSDTVTKVSKKNLHPFDRETQTDFQQFFKNSLKYVRKHLPFPLADGTLPPTPPTKRRKKSGVAVKSLGADSGIATYGTAGSESATYGTAGSESATLDLQISIGVDASAMPTGSRAETPNESRQIVVPKTLVDDREPSPPLPPVPVLVDLVCDSTTAHGQVVGGVGGGGGGEEEREAKRDRPSISPSTTFTPVPEGAAAASDSAFDVFPVYSAAEAPLDLVSSEPLVENDEYARDEAEVSSTTLDSAAADNEASSPHPTTPSKQSAPPDDSRRIDDYVDDVGLGRVAAVQDRIEDEEPKATLPSESRNSRSTATTTAMTIDEEISLNPTSQSLPIASEESQAEKKTLFFNAISKTFTKKPSDLVWIGLDSLNPGDASPLPSASPPPPLADTPLLAPPPQPPPPDTAERIAAKPSVAAAECVPVVNVAVTTATSFPLDAVQTPPSSITNKVSPENEHPVEIVPSKSGAGSDSSPSKSRSSAKTVISAETDFPSVGLPPQKWTEIPDDVICIRLDDNFDETDDGANDGGSRDDINDGDDTNLGARASCKIEPTEYSGLEGYNRLNKMLQRRMSLTPRHGYNKNYNSRIGLSSSSRSSTPMRSAAAASTHSPSSSQREGMAAASSKKNPPRGAKTHHRLVQDPLSEKKKKKKLSRKPKLLPHPKSSPSPRQRSNGGDDVAFLTYDGVVFATQGVRIICPMCGESHLGYSHVKEHIRGVHSDVRHFLCRLCDFEGHYRNTITNHFKLKHPGEKEVAFIQRDFDLKAFVDRFRAGTSVRNVNIGFEDVAAKFKATEVFPPKASSPKVMSPKAISPKVLSPKAINSKVLPSNMTAPTKRFIDGFGFDTLATTGHLVCPICCKTWKSSEKMRFHIRGLHHPKKHLVCKVAGCGKKFNWRSTIINHQIIDHGKNYGIEKIEVLPLHLGRYLRKYLENQKLARDDEGEDDDDDDGDRDEEGESTADDSAPNQSLAYSFSRQSLSKVKTTTMTTTSKRPLSVMKCEPGTTSSSTTTTMAMTNFRCTLCPSTVYLEDRNSLRDHVIAVHSESKNYVCAVDDCDQAFNCRTGVLTHQKRAHHRHLANRKNLAAGLRALVDIIPDDLERYLVRRFRRREAEGDGGEEEEQLRDPDVSGHHQAGQVVKVVNGICFTYDVAGNVHCPLCQLKFRYAGALKRHVMETHSGEKWYQCLINNCGSRFSKISSVGQHQKKFHGVQFTVTNPKNLRTDPFNLSTFLKAKLKEQEDRENMTNKTTTTPSTESQKSPEDMMKSIIKRTYDTAAIRLINIKEEFFLDDVNSSSRCKVEVNSHMGVKADEDVEREANAENLADASSHADAKSHVDDWEAEANGAVCDRLDSAPSLPENESALEAKTSESHSLLESSKAEELFVCELCSKSFSSRPLFDDHVERVHAPQQTTKMTTTKTTEANAAGKSLCGLCPMAFDSALGAERHRRRFCPARRTCEHCSTVFISGLGLRRHLKFCKSLPLEQLRQQQKQQQSRPCEVVEVHPKPEFGSRKKKNDVDGDESSASDSQNSFKTLRISNIKLGGGVGGVAGKGAERGETTAGVDQNRSFSSEKPDVETESIILSLTNNNVQEESSFRHSITPVVQNAGTSLPEDEEEEESSFRLPITPADRNAGSKTSLPEEDVEDEESTNFRHPVVPVGRTTGSKTSLPDDSDSEYETILDFSSKAVADELVHDTDVGLVRDTEEGVAQGVDDEPRKNSDESADSSPSKSASKSSPSPLESASTSRSDSIVLVDLVEERPDEADGRDNDERSNTPSEIHRVSDQKSPDRSNEKASDLESASTSHSNSIVLVDLVEERPDEADGHDEKSPDFSDEKAPDLSNGRDVTDDCSAWSAEGAAAAKESSDWSVEGAASAAPEFPDYLSDSGRADSPLILEDSFDENEDTSKSFKTTAKLSLPATGYDERRKLSGDGTRGRFRYGQKRHSCSSEGSARREEFRDAAESLGDAVGATSGSDVVTLGGAAANAVEGLEADAMDRVDAVDSIMSAAEGEDAAAHAADAADGENTAEGEDAADTDDCIIEYLTADKIVSKEKDQEFMKDLDRKEKDADLQKNDTNLKEVAPNLMEKDADVEVKNPDPYRFDGSDEDEVPELITKKRKIGVNKPWSLKKRRKTKEVDHTLHAENETPISEKMAPVAETPVLETDPSVHQTESPFQETETPAQETESPFQETEMPAQETESPFQDTELSAQETKFLCQETESPISETETQNVETETSIPDNETPILRTEAPLPETDTTNTETGTRTAETYTPNTPTDKPTQDAETSIESLDGARRSMGTKRKLGPPRAFPCNYCHYSFSASSNLKCHVKYKHKGEIFSLDHIVVPGKNDVSSGVGSAGGSDSVGGGKLMDNPKEENVSATAKRRISKSGSSGSDTLGSSDVSTKLSKDIGGFVVRVNPVDGKLLCPLCGEACRGSLGLKRHALNEHRSSVKSFRCKWRSCGLKFVDIQSALRHLEKVHKSCNLKKHVEEMPFHLATFFKRKLNVENKDENNDKKNKKAEDEIQTTLKAYRTIVNQGSSSSKKSQLSKRRKSVSTVCSIVNESAQSSEVSDMLSPKHRVQTDASQKEPVAVKQSSSRRISSASSEEQITPRRPRSSSERLQPVSGRQSKPIHDKTPNRITKPGRNPTSSPDNTPSRRDSSSHWRGARGRSATPSAASGEDSSTPKHGIEAASKSSLGSRRFDSLEIFEGDIVVPRLRDLRMPGESMMPGSETWGVGAVGVGKGTLVKGRNGSGTPFSSSSPSCSSPSCSSTPSITLPFMEQFKDTILLNRDPNSGELRDTFLESLVIDSLLND